MTRVAVIGAAGYVGGHLVRRLLEEGHEVTAVARQNAAILLAGVPVEHVLPNRVAEVRPADVVINLAFPNAGSIFEFRERNRELVAMIRALAGAQGRVIHVSTLAVFGFALERLQTPGPVRQQLDYLYVETKVEFEQLVAAAFRGRSLDIVRLGNVWGPASAGWTAALADKLLFGDPVAVDGADGYSNVTDVTNVADYLTWLVTAGVAGHRYHHLAEFSAVRWSGWTGRVAELLGTVPVSAPAVGQYPASLRQELGGMLTAHGPVALAQEAVFGRFTGALLRRLVRRVPASVAQGMRRRRAMQVRQATPPMPPGSDPVFLATISCPRQFLTATIAGWSPPVDVAASWDRAQAWFGHAGYAKVGA